MSYIPVMIRLAGKVRKAVMVKMNVYTMWVALPDGHIIKRHLRKHTPKELAK